MIDFLEHVNHVIMLLIGKTIETQRHREREGVEIESERKGGGEKVNPDYEMKYFRMIFLLIISLAAHTTCSTLTS